MAHFAELDINNYVLRVVKISNDDILGEDGNESEEVGVEFCKSLFGEHTNWKQTSYNANFRNVFAGAGHTYNETLDVFISPAPYSSWIFSYDTLGWVPPVEYPSDAPTLGVGSYTWDELNQQWVEVTE